MTTGYFEESYPPYLWDRSEELPPDPIPPGAVVVNGLSVTVTAPTYSNRGRISWGDGGGYSSYISPRTHVYAAAGTYTITLNPNAEGEPDITADVTVAAAVQQEEPAEEVAP